MRIPALILGLILPLVMVFSAALVIQAGVQMDSAMISEQRIISRLLPFPMIFTPKFLLS